MSPKYPWARAPGGAGKDSPRRAGATQAGLPPPRGRSCAPRHTPSNVRSRLRLTGRHGGPQDQPLPAPASTAALLTRAQGKSTSALRTAQPWKDKALAPGVTSMTWKTCHSVNEDTEVSATGVEKCGTGDPWRLGHRPALGGPASGQGGGRTTATSADSLHVSFATVLKGSEVTGGSHRPGEASGAGPEHCGCLRRMRQPAGIPRTRDSRWRSRASAALLRPPEGQADPDAEAPVLASSRL